MEHQKVLKSGIIGTGTIAPWHAKSIKEIEGCCLVAVADVIKEKAKIFSEEYECDYYEDYWKILKRDDIDIVHICTPSGTHADIASDAVSAGKNVIVEKPIDINLEKINKLIKSAKDKGVKLGGIFQNRFNTNTKKVFQAIKENRLGKIVMADVINKSLRMQEYYDQDKWRGTIALDGGALMNQGIHGVDLLQYLISPVASVSRIFALTKTLARKIEAEDNVVAILEYSNGAIGAIVASTTIYPGFGRRLGIYGERGSIELDGGNIASWHFSKSQEGDKDIKLNSGLNTTRGSNPKSISVEPHKKNIIDFVQSVREDRDPLVSGSEARTAVEIILGVYQSSITGDWVELKALY